MSDQNLATPTDCRPLFDLMKKFKKLAPWDWMEEVDVFGVQNPDTGELGFVSVMGMAGEHYAIGLYLGAEGLYGFWNIEEQGPFLQPEDLLKIPQLQASFEDRDMIDKHDYNLIKSLKLKFRGRNAWPQFRSIRPGFAPWYIEADEARFLTYALEQLLEVAPRLEEDFDLIEFEDERDYLVRVADKEDGKLVWRDQVMRIEPPEPSRLDITLSEALTQSVAKLPRGKYTLEVDFFMLMTMIGEKNERPYFPYVMLLLDATHDLIVGVEMMSPQPSLQDMWSKLGATLLNILVKHDTKPREIRVANPLLHATLKPYAKELKIKIKLVSHLPALSMARMELESTFMR